MAQKAVHGGADHRSAQGGHSSTKVVELCRKSLGGLAPQEYAETRAGLQLALVSTTG